MTTQPAASDEKILDTRDIILAIIVAFIATIMMSMINNVFRSTAQSQSYVGLEDIRVLNCTPYTQYINLLNAPPYTPWVSATFHNDGPDSAFISINNPDEFGEYKPGEDKQISMLSGQRRIEFIYYKCEPAKTATVRVVGKY
jgi:hypothetical protein